MSVRANYQKINLPAIRQMAGVKEHLGSIDAKLKALVDLRVSQINGCVYCMDLHSNEAREAGETQQRLDVLPGWHESDFFSESEKAALAWAESLTYVSETGAPDEVYEELQRHFSEQQIVDLTLIIGVMNAWNRLAVGLRKDVAVRP